MREHPYVHIFPDLEEFAALDLPWDQLGNTMEYRPTLGQGTIEYRYGRRGADINTLNLRTNTIDISTAKNGLTYFIYNPWFEPVFVGEDSLEENDRRLAENASSSYHVGSYYRPEVGLGPYWFGNNSSRGVLAETVAELLEEAKEPQVIPAQRGWWMIKPGRPGRTYEVNLGKLRDWTIEEYISTTVSSFESLRSGTDAETGQNIEINRPTPKVEWEILHPQLPILRITAHAEGQNLPLTNPNEEEQQGLTSYSVSFVMSVQHRWDSFQDPNRWIIRFKEGLALYPPPLHLYTEGNAYSQQLHRDLSVQPPELELTYPNYWDDTDYMQHRIIGPVVLTVHSSTVLRPGNYSKAPRITHWEAPGHILTNQQVEELESKRVNSVFGQSVRRPPRGLAREERRRIAQENWEELRNTPGGTVPRLWPDLSTPNPGFPLPGHVMAGTEQGPGTEPWREYGMDGYEW